MIGFQSVTAVTISGAFVFGMMLVLLGSIRLLLAKRFELSEGRIDWLLDAMNLSLIPMMLVGGMLIDALGVQVVFVAGSLIAAGGIFALALSETALAALGSIVLAGAGGACLSAGSSVLMAQAFFPGNEVASQNLGNVFFGLGALVTPTLSQLLLERLQYRRALGVLAIICLAPAVIAIFTAREAFAITSQLPDLRAVLGNPIVWLAGIVFFLYGPLESSLGTWGSRYLLDKGIRQRGAAWLLTGFWFTFLAARLAVALWSENDLAPQSYFHGWLIVLLGLCSAVVLGNMAGARTPLGAATGLLLVGAFFGPIFPTLVGILFQRFPHERGTAYGAMFAIGATGNLLVQPFFGAYGRRNTLQKAMRIPMVLALLLALMACFLALYPLFG
jgi:fucose permease